MSTFIKFQMYHLAREEGTVNKQTPPPNKEVQKKETIVLSIQMNKKPKM